MTHKVDITTAAARRKLTPRTSPYYNRVGRAYLGFRCTGSDGVGTWVGRCYMAGKQRFAAFGRHNDYRDAVAALNRWLEQLESERVGGVSTRGSTVTDACREYIAEFVRRDGDGRQSRYARNILEAKVTGREAAAWKSAVAPDRLAAIRLADLTRADVTRWRNSLIATDEANAPRAKRATAARQFKTLIAALNFAHSAGMVASAAAWSGVKGFADVQARQDESHRYLEPAERRRLIDACPNSIKHFVELLAATGARPVELVRATVADFDKRNRTLTLWDKKGVGAKKRVRHVPLDALPGALDLMRRIVRDRLPAAPLFDHDGNAQFYLLPFKAAVKAAGLPESDSAYSLRHSFISDAVAAGVPLVTVAGVVGTSATQIERTYNKLLKTHAAAAFARMAAV